MTHQCTDCTHRLRCCSGCRRDTFKMASGSAKHTKPIVHFIAQDESTLTSTCEAISCRTIRWPTSRMHCVSFAVVFKCFCWTDIVNIVTVQVRIWAWIREGLLCSLGSRTTVTFWKWNVVVRQTPLCRSIQSFCAAFSVQHCCLLICGKHQYILGMTPLLVHHGEVPLALFCCLITTARCSVSSYWVKHMHISFTCNVAMPVVVLWERVGMKGQKSLPLYHCFTYVLTTGICMHRCTNYDLAFCWMWLEPYKLYILLSLQ